MARPRRDYLRNTHNAVLDWAQWIVQHIESSAIGYPSKTVEARMMKEGGTGKAPAKCIVPDVMMPHYVAVIDRAVRSMPAELYAIIELKYLKTGHPSRHKVDAALTWINGHTER